MNLSEKIRDIDFASVDTLEEAGENAGFNDREIGELTTLLFPGQMGRDELIMIPTFEFLTVLRELYDEGCLIREWCLEDVYRLKRGLYPGIWEQTNIT
ncbi:hypothetical protein ACFLZ1_01340 [Patescibacteria group bacterium]